MKDTKLYLTRRSNGYYYLGFRKDADKIQWQTTKCTVKSDALKFLKAFKTQDAEHSPAVVPTLSEYLPVFNERTAGLIRPSTLKAYSLTVKQFIDVVGDKPLSAYTLTDIDKFRTARLAKNKPVTVNIELRAIKSLFNKAEKWGVVTSSIMRNVPQLRVVSNLPTFLTPKDFKVIYAATQNQTYKDLLMWSVLTGCRISESLQVRWKDVELRKRQIVIESNGKFLTKSGRARVIPINDALLLMLERRYAERQGSELVFHRRGYPLDRVTVTHKFKRLVRDLDLNPSYKFHSLRHTFASWLVQRNVPIYTVSKLLGHSQISTTQIYAHLSNESMAAEVNKIAL